MSKKTKKSRISPMWRRTVSHIFTKPATTKYPFVKPTLPDDLRGQVKYEIKDCNRIELTQDSPGFQLDVRAITGANCRVCERDCPAKAIEIVLTADGKKRPQIDLNKCVFCHQCVESCPREAIKSSVLYELATTNKASLIMKPKEEKTD
jgi:formate hydrogenlyase subunit 6/NADH:ubiquinone oxidoreductase subunit I